MKLPQTTPSAFAAFWKRTQEIVEGYTLAGAIHVKFRVQIAEDTDDLVLRAFYRTPDSDAKLGETPSTTTVNHMTSVPLNATDAEVHWIVRDLARRAYLHELDEFLRFKGERVKDPHAGERDWEWR